MQRATRLATLSLLLVGAVTAIALIAWSLYIRSTDLASTMGGRAGLRTGLELAARLNTSYLGFRETSATLSASLTTGATRASADTSPSSST